MIQSLTSIANSLKRSFALEPITPCVSSQCNYPVSGRAMQVDVSELLKLRGENNVRLGTKISAASLLPDETLSIVDKYFLKMARQEAATQFYSPRDIYPAINMLYENGRAVPTNRLGWKTIGDVVFDNRDALVCEELFYGSDKNLWGKFSLKAFGNDYEILQKFNSSRFSFSKGYAGEQEARRLMTSVYLEFASTRKSWYQQLSWGKLIFQGHPVTYALPLGALAIVLGIAVANEA